MTSELRISEDIVKGTRIFFTMGYILRVIPSVLPILTTVNIAGSFLTFVGWLSIFKKLGSKAYLVASIGSIILLASLSFSTYIAMIEEEATIEMIPERGLTFYEYKELFRNTILITKKNMEDPFVYLPEVFIALGILLEVPGVAQLGKDSRKYIPLYLAVLFIIIALLNIVVAVLHPISAHGLNEVLDTVDRAESLLDLDYAYSKFFLAILPLAITAIVTFILAVASYVLFAYKYWKLYGELVKLRIIVGSGSAVESI